MAVTTRESDKFMLRLPDGMREAIRLAAEANNRSMNAEIVARLAESLEKGAEPFSPDDIQALMEMLDRKTVEFQKVLAELAQKGKFP